jgi:Circularly permutated YpsA SLOG family
MTVSKIISGAQTGVDRAALDAAIELGVPHGGWVPKGRKAEDGIIPEKYKMVEMPTERYAGRTERNILDSDGTLIISRGALTEGSDLTRQLAIKHARPWLHADLERIGAAEAARTISAWLKRKGISVLNVAGPRASKDPGIYRLTRDILKRVMKE